MVDYAGLVSHLSHDKAPFALLTMQATATAGVLKRSFPERFKSLFSAEHGFFGIVAPGEKTGADNHPYWKLPIHSLYGEHRRPTPEMLEGVERMVVDLCDIAVRCYTYLATLKNTLESCAAAGIPVTVVDREIPLGGIVDGPMREDAFSSFVAPVNVPLCHAMTPGECALWMRDALPIPVELTVIKLRNWNHRCRAPWANFVPPSPAIRSWDSAVMYPLTVFTEAYPAVDCDRAGSLAFRVVGAPWIDQKDVIGELASPLASCGVEVRPYRYRPGAGDYAGEVIDGMLFSVADPDGFYPVKAGVTVLSALMRRYGDEAGRGARPEWADKLYGGASVREAIAGGDAARLFERWADERCGYLESKVDIYG
jgi:uncharacterized protein YbbC (DUF1343 family)